MWAIHIWPKIWDTSNHQIFWEMDGNGGSLKTNRRFQYSTGLILDLFWSSPQSRHLFFDPPLRLQPMHAAFRRITDPETRSKARWPVHIEKSQEWPRGVLNMFLWDRIFFLGTVGTCCCLSHSANFGVPLWIFRSSTLKEAKQRNMVLQDFCILTQILCSGCCITDTFRASPSTSNQVWGIQPKAQRKHVQDQIRISFWTHQHKLHSKLHFHTCLTSHRCWSTNWALSGSFYPAFPVTAFLLCPFIAVLRVKLGEVFPGLVFNVFPGFTTNMLCFIISNAKQSVRSTSDFESLQ